MMFIWIIIVAVIVFLYFDKGGLKFERKTNPLNIIDERLANGEISLEEYKELKDELRGE